MNLLLTNDDGFDAPGLAVLARVLEPLGTVTVVAPATEQSARSHAFTMNKALHFHSVRPGWYALEGTPADCVYVALHHLCEVTPDVVVSGINRGTNLGDDVHYSGTVGAAMEGALHGVKALAVSQEVVAEDGESQHWETAALLVQKLLGALEAQAWPDPMVLNLNVPNVPSDTLPQVQIASMGRRRYHPKVDVRQDPRGRSYCWIGGAHQHFSRADGTDGLLFEQGYATLTPLGINLTSHSSIDWLREQRKGPHSVLST